jgi:hypothetical protein
MNRLAELREVEHRSGLIQLDDNEGYVGAHLFTAGPQIGLSPDDCFRLGRVWLGRARRRAGSNPNPSPLF